MKIPEKMKRKYFVVVGLQLTKPGLFEVRGIEADRLREGVSAYVGVSMFVLSCLQIRVSACGVCVNVDSMGGFNHCVFFPIIFIMEWQNEDVGGFRLQCLTEGLKEDK